MMPRMAVADDAFRDPCKSIERLSLPDKVDTEFHFVVHNTS